MEKIRIYIYLGELHNLYKLPKSELFRSNLQDRRMWNPKLWNSKMKKIQFSLTCQTNCTWNVQQQCWWLTRVKDSRFGKNQGGHTIYQFDHIKGTVAKTTFCVSYSCMGNIICILNGHCGVTFGVREHAVCSLKGHELKVGALLTQSKTMAW